MKDVLHPCSDFDKVMTASFTQSRAGTTAVAMWGHQIERASDSMSQVGQVGICVCSKETPMLTWRMQHSALHGLPCYPCVHCSMGKICRMAPQGQCRPGPGSDMTTSHQG